MTSISLATELERIYAQPVYIWGFRVISIDTETIKLEVALTVEGENQSTAFVEIIK